MRKEYIAPETIVINTSEFCQIEIPSASDEAEHGNAKEADFFDDEADEFGLNWNFWENQ